MSPKSKKALEAIRRALESETEPSRLSKEEYLEVCEELAADLVGFIDCTKQELGIE